MSASSQAATITITGHHLDIGEALKRRSQEAVMNAASRYGVPLGDAQVSFNRNGKGNTTCKVMIRVGSRTMRSQSQQHQPHRALDGAMNHLDTQLRRSQDRVTKTPTVRVDKMSFLDSGLVGDMIPPPPTPFHATM